MSAICVSTGTGREMHFRCVDSSVDNVLLQTSTSRFLSSLIFLSSVPLTRCCITLQILLNGLCSGLLRATYLEWWNSLIFFLYFNSNYTWSVSPGNAETDVRWAINLNGQLMTSFVSLNNLLMATYIRYSCTKGYENPTIHL